MIVNWVAKVRKIGRSAKPKPCFTALAAQFRTFAPLQKSAHEQAQQYLPPLQKIRAERRHYVPGPASVSGFSVYLFRVEPAGAKLHKYRFTCANKARIAQALAGRA